MAELAARHLTGHVKKPILVVNRTFETACALAEELCGDALPMDRLEEALVDADVTITSTASCEALIRKDLLKTVMRKRRSRPIFLIDIAIPRDVDPEANDIDGVYLYNIDDLQAVVTENVGERSQEAVKGGRIVAEEVIKFMGWTRTLEAAPTIVALKDKLETIRKCELTRLNGRLAELGPAERETVEVITRSIINKIAHDPIVFLKRAGSSAKRNFYLATAQSMFNLDQPATESRDRDEESLPE
jgi:glutamyl-tRNA reductase